MLVSPFLLAEIVGGCRTPSAALEHPIRSCVYPPADYRRVREGEVISPPPYSSLGECLPLFPSANLSHVMIQTKQARTYSSTLNSVCDCETAYPMPLKSKFLHLHPIPSPRIQMRRPPKSMSLRDRRAQISRFGRTETRRFIDIPLVPQWSDEEE